MFRLFGNTLTADDNYSRRNMRIFSKQLQTPLSQKEKTFSWLFVAFLKFVWNVEYFQNKDEYPSMIISEIIESARGGYLNV